MQATGSAGAQGGTVQAGAPPVATEWFTELPGERYFGFENVRAALFSPRAIPTPRQAADTRSARPDGC